MKFINQKKLDRADRTREVIHVLMECDTEHEFNAVVEIYRKDIIDLKLEHYVAGAIKRLCPSKEGLFRSAIKHHRYLPHHTSVNNSCKTNALSASSVSFSFTMAVTFLFNNPLLKPNLTDTAATSSLCNNISASIFRL